MPITESDLSGLRDGNVVTTSGDKIGSIGQIYLDDQTGEPSFVTANTGLFGTSQSFVPLQGASVRDGDIVVNYDKDTVKNAPRIDDDGKLSPEEEDRLYEYYGLGGGRRADHRLRPHRRRVRDDRWRDHRHHDRCRLRPWRRRRCRRRCRRWCRRRCRPFRG